VSRRGSPTPLPSLRGGPARGRAVPGGQGLSRREILIALGLGAAALAGGGIYLGSGATSPDGEVLYFAEKTTRSPGRMAPEVRKRFFDLASQGGGRIVPFAVGERLSPLRPVDLAVVRQGETENDPGLLGAVITHRLDTLDRECGRAPVGQPGFNLVRALQSMEAESRKFGRPLEVWFQSTVLSSTGDPLKVAALVAADPKAAVEQLMAKTTLAKLDLSRVNLHPVLLTPIGDGQEPLSLAAEAWRAAFITQLGSALGAQVSPPIRSDVTGPAWPNSSTVAPIVSKEDPTPVTTLPPDPGGEPPAAIDNAAFFPDSDTVLDLAGFRPKIALMVARYNAARGAFPMEVKGFTAAFGNSDSARVLSRQRAAVIGDLLAAGGVPRSDIHCLGVGFDEAAYPTEAPRSAAQRVVIMKLVKRT
jgi:outer membrane protein OmpA-like peptidoglycan-associated protein